MYPDYSYLRIEGNFKTAGNADVANNSAVAFINNELMHLFSNARYFLGCEVLEYFENAGIITTIHNYLTKSRNYSGIVGSGYLTGERLLLMQLMNPGELEIL